MIFRFIFVSVLIAMSMTSTLHAALKVTDFDKGGSVFTYIYGTSPIPSDLNLYNRNSTVSFGNLSVYGSARFGGVYEYVDLQAYLPKYSREAIKIHRFFMEYLIQNADDKSALLAVSKQVGMAELCLYFAYSDSVKFVNEHAFNMLIDDDVAGQRLKSGVSLVVNKLSESPYSQDQMSYAVVNCSSFLGIGLPAGRLAD